MTSNPDQPNAKTNPQTDPQRALDLAPASAEAIDRLFEHGLAPDALDTEPRLAALFAPLDNTPAPDPELASLTMLRVLRADRTTTAGTDPTLTDADGVALDAWMDGATSDAPRATRLEAMRTLVVDTPQSPAAGLADRTMAAIAAGIQPTDQAADEPRSFRFPSFRMADAIAAAAVLLIAGAVAFPVLSSVRRTATNMACASNLAGVGAGMGLYAGDYTDTLPVATAGFAGTWLDVGSTPDRSNSANLYTMVRNKYAELTDLACPGNPNARHEPASQDATDWASLPEVSYSYQVMDRPRRMWRQQAEGRTPVVLADRSPVILRVAARQAINPWERSPNHGDTGQRTLKADGSAVWLDAAEDEAGDNIWLPRPVERAIHEVRTRMGLIEGDEAPAGEGDVFLAP